MSPNCIFCDIINGAAPGQILHQDNETIVFKDIKPAATHHYLSIPKEHILDINCLKSDGHKVLLDKLIYNGKKVLEDNGGNVNDATLGFHCPPFNSVPHLHLHIISPASEMSFLNSVIFKPNTWWFRSVNQVLEKLENPTDSKL